MKSLSYFFTIATLASLITAPALCADSDDTTSDNSLRVPRPTTQNEQASAAKIQAPKGQTAESKTPLKGQTAASKTSPNGQTATSQNPPKGNWLSNKYVPSKELMNIPVMKVEDKPKSKGVGLGMLGMYALCPENDSPCYITNVFSNSDLVQYGVTSGDLLVKINGVSPFEYMNSMHPTQPGAMVELTVEQNGLAKTISAKLNEMQTFTPFLGSYATWATSHISFLSTHRQEYQRCGLF